jgi:hypothetical protein
MYPQHVRLFYYWKIIISQRIVFGQSSEAEGKQDQYYITCGQMSLPAPEIAPPVSLESIESVRFPGAYKNGNLDPKGSPPGPDIAQLSLAGPEGAGAAKASPTVRQSGTPSDSDDQGFAFSDGAPECATSCLSKKISEHAQDQLGTPCTNPSSSPPGSKKPFCQCKDEKFVEAFSQCSRDHCQASLLFLKFEW